MIKETIDKLPEQLNTIRTLKREFVDTTNKEFLVDSNLKVINFDQFSKKYSSKFHLPVQPKTNDALYIDQDGKWTFIEFKNGNMKPADIYRKLYDSLIMLNEFEFVSWEFSRKNITYILVYNEDEYNSQYGEGLQVSASRTKIYNGIRNRANQTRNLYDLKKLEGYLFESIYTYNQDEFKANFVEKYEKLEAEMEGQQIS